MKKMNSSISEKSKDENSSKLLRKKRIFFYIEKDCENKKLSSEKYSEDNLSEGRWSYNEQIKFIEGLSKAGTNWKKIKEKINTRTLPQIRSHAQKFFKRLKRCKSDKLGIDFTSNSIRSIKDMINHIKTVNNNYDISNVFIHLCDYQQKNYDGLKENNLFKNNDNINISNVNSQISNKDNNNNNNNFDFNNLNNILLIQSLSNMNNTLNAFILNYLNKSIVINNLINRFYNNIKDLLSKEMKSSNSLKASNNFNINEIEDNKKIL